MAHGHCAGFFSLVRAGRSAAHGEHAIIPGEVLAQRNGKLHLMFKIAVFGFYWPDQEPPARRGWPTALAINTRVIDAVGMGDGAAETRIGLVAAPVFVKLKPGSRRISGVRQSLSFRMASGAGLLRCDGNVAIIVR